MPLNACLGRGASSDIRNRAALLTHRRTESEMVLRPRIVDPKNLSQRTCTDSAHSTLP